MNINSPIKLSKQQFSIIGQIIGILLLIQLISGLMGLGLREVDDYFLDYEYKVIIIHTSIVFLFTPAIIYLIKVWDIEFNFKHNSFSNKTFGVIVLIGISTYFLGNIFNIIQFISSLLENVLVFDLFKIRKPLGSMSIYITDIILVIILGPILEEVLYRKIIFNKLRTVFSVSFSIVFTSILFSIMHLNPYGLISFFIVGVILNYVYYLTNNLLLNIIFHSLLNVLFYLFERSEIAFSHRAILMCFCFYILCGVTLYQSLKYLKIQKTKMR